MPAVSDIIAEIAADVDIPHVPDRHGDIPAGYSGFLFEGTDPFHPAKGFQNRFLPRIVIENRVEKDVASRPEQHVVGIILIGASPDGHAGGFLRLTVTVLGGRVIAGEGP